MQAGGNLKIPFFSPMLPTPEFTFGSRFFHEQTVLQVELLSMIEDDKGRYIVAKQTEKNRCQKILPTASHCCRLLGPFEDETSGLNSRYINASHVYFEGEHAILAQAPTAQSVSDFWQLVFEQHAPLIVVAVAPRELADLSHARFWPQDGDNTLKLVLPYGTLTVAADADAEEVDGIALRTLWLSFAPHDDTGARAAQPSAVAPYAVTMVHITCWEPGALPSAAHDLWDVVQRCWEVMDAAAARPWFAEYAAHQDAAVTAAQDTHLDTGADAAPTFTRAAPAELCPSVPVPRGGTHFSVPAVLQCASGAGRSAALLLLWWAMRRVDAELAADVHGLRRRLRVAQRFTEELPAQLEPPVGAQYVPYASAHLNLLAAARHVRAARSPFALGDARLFAAVHAEADKYWLAREEDVAAVVEPSPENSTRPASSASVFASSYEGSHEDSFGSSFASAQ
eukprot:gnl/Chilomastix_cuspidata/2417.p1 GENE.gnl/Chilomastix_cuspidata/2417~~gnl/Chilomastix_cuspidata/2417.p1  ORF type:complete len:453 (+),score=99.56 gnl/Chilomastix_cuspidata/2417:170-1528(+)